jgi:cell division septation protein DedD
METRRSSLCPLCKRPAEAGESRQADSRLCGNCQSLVGTILPRGKTGPAASAARQARYAPTFASAALAEEAVSLEKADDREVLAGLSTEPMVEFYDAGLEATQEEPAPDYYYEHAPHEPRHTEAPQVETHQAEIQQEETRQEKTHHSETRPAQAAPEMPAPPLEAKPVTKVAAPDWDYTTVSEWPLAVTADRGRARPRPGGLNRGLMALAAGLLILAAGYFLVYRPLFAGGQEGQNDPAAASASSSAPAAEGPSEKPAEKDPGRQSQSPAAGNPQASPAAQPDAGHGGVPAAGQGRFSLQAASFPDEQAANEYSERLIRAGVPGYVVAADLGRRGRWFRVRVGRFESASAAEQYAAQSRARARAAGLSVELVVCDYEKP